MVRDRWEKMVTRSTHGGQEKFYKYLMVRYSFYHTSHHICLVVHVKGLQDLPDVGDNPYSVAADHEHHYVHTDTGQQHLPLPYILLEILIERKLILFFLTSLLRVVSY